MPVIKNYATLEYGYASGETEVTKSKTVLTSHTSGSITLSAASLSDSYRLGDNLAFFVSLQNNTGTNIYNPKIMDDLGILQPQTQDTEEEIVSINPLRYIRDSAQAMLNGAAVPVDTHIVEGINSSVTFIFPEKFYIPDQGILTVFYLTKVNPGMEIGLATQIENLIEFFAYSDETSEEEPDIYAQSGISLSIETYADLIVVKEIIDDDARDKKVKYSFTVVNQGNAIATNVILTDVFDAGFLPTEVTVFKDGAAQSYYPEEDGDSLEVEELYRYNADTNTLTLPTGSTKLQLPGAGGNESNLLKIEILGYV